MSIRCEASIAQLRQRFGAGEPPLGLSGTAVGFDAGLDAAHFLAAMASANEQLIPARLALAIQLPFCGSLCYHCARMKKVTRNARLMSSYVDVLCEELRLKSALIDEDRLVEQLWLVGGSPLYLGVPQLGRMLAEVSEHYALSGSTNRYFFVEIDARAATPQYIAQLSIMGMNALRMWVPAMSRPVQKAINREQSTEALSSLVMAARRTSFQDVTLATRFGLPMQTLAALQNDIDWFGDLGPDNILIERYQHQPGLHAAQRLIPRQLLPDLELVDDMESLVHERMALAGYLHLGFGHFTRIGSVLDRARSQGQLQRGLMGFMIGAGSDTIGIGAGAVSRIEESLFRSPTDIEAYLQNVRAGGLAIDGGMRPTIAFEQLSFVLERMLCTGECRARDWSICFDDPFETYLQGLRRFVHDLILDGDITIGADSLTLTEQGRRCLGKVLDSFEKTLQEKRLAPLH